MVSAGVETQAETHIAAAEEHVTTNTDYALSNDWKDARQRLGLLEEVFDPGTIRHLERIGVGEGWRCLEAGAGSGSIADWLSRRVGPSGHVLATDINTRLLDALKGPNVEVRRHDIVADALPECGFDLIYARALLCHLPGRDRALDGMLTALKPGGWLLIEEPDFVTVDLVCCADAGGPEVFRKVIRAKANFDQRREFDAFYGRKVFNELRIRGMTNVSAEGRMDVCAGGEPMSRFLQLSFEQLQPQLQAGGDLSQPDLEAYLRILADSSNVFMWPTVIATSGQKPEFCR
jgi:SAM-dependent methyltransferase